MSECVCESVRALSVTVDFIATRVRRFCIIKKGGTTLWRIANILARLDNVLPHNCICMAKLFSYQLLFGASIRHCLIFSCLWPSESCCLLPLTLPATTTIFSHTRCEFTIHFIRIHSVPFHTIRYLLRTTKWYTTIKQFKFISVCDQFCAHRFRTSIFPDGLSSVARIIVIIIIFWPETPARVGVSRHFYGWFPIRLRPLFSLIRMEFSILKFLAWNGAFPFALHRRVWLLRTNHKDSIANAMHTSTQWFDRSHWIWNAHYNDGSNLLFHISSVLSISWKLFVDGDDGDFYRFQIIRNVYEHYWNRCLQNHACVGVHACPFQPFCLRLHACVSIYGFHQLSYTFAIQCDSIATGIQRLSHSSVSNANTFIYSWKDSVYHNWNGRFEGKSAYFLCILPRKHSQLNSYIWLSYRMYISRHTHTYT